MCAALALLLCFPLTPVISAQGPPIDSALASLGGLVLDAENGTPIIGARVIVLGIDMETVTDPEGHFALYELEPGSRVIQVHLGARAAAPRRIELSAGQHTEIRISLSIPGDGPELGISAVELPPLEVEIEGGAPPGKLREFYERADRGFGHFITGAQIRERSPFRSSDLLREVPGLSMIWDPGGRHGLRIGRNSRCETDFYLDGTPAPGLRIDDVPPGDIGGIEIYRGAAEVPVEYRRATTCAAILIWSRDPAEP